MQVALPLDFKCLHGASPIYYSIYNCPSCSLTCHRRNWRSFGCFQTGIHSSFRSV